MHMSVTPADLIRFLTMIHGSIFHDISNGRISHHLCSMTLLPLSDWLYLGSSVQPTN